MEQFIEFMGNHPYEFLALGVVLGLLAWNILGEQIQGIKQLAPQQAALLMNHEDAIVIDVREENEYLQGHILNSMNVPSSSFSSKLNRLEKYRQRPIIISCLSGHRTIQVGKTLKANGFEKIFHLKGGITAWQNANLPLIKGKESSK